jgi:hypothetical protein
MAVLMAAARRTPFLTQLPVNALDVAGWLSIAQCHRSLKLAAAFKVQQASRVGCLATGHCSDHSGWQRRGDDTNEDIEWGLL